jgi:hypothetical protein
MNKDDNDDNDKLCPSDLSGVSESSCPEIGVKTSMGRLICGIGPSL